MASAKIRLNRLLDFGFYPAELPPIFQTRNFSSAAARMKPRADYVGSTTFFNGSTFRGVLRSFGIVNPVNFLNLSELIAREWPAISRTFRLSASSGARPKFLKKAEKGRAIQSSSLALQRRSKAHLASAFPIILNLDINRFYSSIYSHSIPWAVLGKEKAKKLYKVKRLKDHWSDELDILVRNCNQAQTVGIAIGPDTSRIISEIILSRVDYELCGKGTGLRAPQIFHNIDDYQFGVFNISSAEDAESRFTRVISRYELKINDFKTKLDHGINFSPNNFQREFDILSSKKGRNFVEHFFDIVYRCTNNHSNVNVIGYALKRFAKQLARNSEQDLVREYLQRLIFAAPHQARWALPLLLGIYRAVGVSIEARKLICWGIEVSSRRNDVGTTLWFLYAAIFLSIRLNRDDCNQCVGMSNELVDLMMLHGRHLGLFAAPVSDLRQRYKDSDFKSEAWIILYEVDKQGWDTSSSFKKIGGAEDSGNHYEQLRKNDVEFYLSSPELFDVTAFDGWNITQEDFELEGPKGDDDIDPFGIDWDWENYD